MQHTDEKQIAERTIDQSAENPGHCPRCGRPAAASRPQCLYCGSMLQNGDFQPAIAAASHKAADLAQAGFNLFAKGSNDPAMAAKILAIDEESIAALLAEPQFPVARTATEAEASDLSSRLAAAGTVCSVASDADLALREPNTRIASIKFDGSILLLMDFNTKETISINAADIVLLVEGRISTSRTDSMSKGRRAESANGVRETVTATDDPVLDLYSSLSQKGFRIVPSGFDFSILGDRKCLTAAENWNLMIKLLNEKFPTAKLDHEYRRVRRSLEAVWPVSTSSASAGKVNSGFGRRDFSSVSSASSLTQFNLYSRSRRYLL